jgi:putative zinc finger/helix-turn-helix YgiT family protein
VKCTSCDSDKVVKATLEETRRFGDYAFVATIAGRRCEACGETFAPAPALERLERKIAAELARGGAHSPEAFKFMRKIAELRSNELAGLLGVEPETVSRWESGANPLDPKAVAVLGALVLDALAGQATTRQRLEAIQRPHREPPKRIAV